MSVGRYATRQEINYLYAVRELLNSELADVENLLPVTRQERGFLNFGGKVLNILFGTATSAELQVLHQALQGTKEQQTVITDSIEHQLN